VLYFTSDEIATISSIYTYLEQLQSITYRVDPGAGIQRVSWIFERASILFDEMLTTFSFNWLAKISL